MIAPREWILSYRAKIDANQLHQPWPAETKALNTEMHTLGELIKFARPELEEKYEWWAGHPYGFCLPEGPEFDAVLALAAADVRATREEGAPETNLELYVERVPVRQAGDAEETAAERGEKETEQSGAVAARMKKLRESRAWAMQQGLEDSF
ncbi:MAG TPA: hypothetical protein VE377_09155 [Candidatus Dormibacteraeota bacterium]|nr:hypothetical protein [Candidatus Dormibacteraeota bacterium]